MRRARFQEKDFYYEEDWAALSASGDLSLQTAFSRSNPDGSGTRVYVQDRIREQVYMPTDVKRRGSIETLGCFIFDFRFRDEAFF